MQYATVGSNVAVQLAIAAAACHTEQTPLQIFLGCLCDNLLFWPSMACWGTHRASAGTLQVLASRQLQSLWIHPCRICVWKHGSQRKRDPHLFRNPGHGGSHSGVGIHARPAEAL